MKKAFDYNQKILVAVEFGISPKRLTDMPENYHLFQRIPLSEVEKAFNEKEPFFVRLFGGKKFHDVIDQRMGYWEQRIPLEHQCFVHYAHGNEKEINSLYERLISTSPGFVLCGVYEVEPRSSAFPKEFPIDPTPAHWFLGEDRPYTERSVFWFNFFPDQKYLFELTFRTWVLFQALQLKECAEINKLVHSVGADKLVTTQIDPFIQINLCRFTSIEGYFQSAYEAGKHTFTHENDYKWYGMLLNKIDTANPT